MVLKALPLCIPLVGLLRHRMYTYRWVSLVVWLYFTEGVVRAWSDKAPSNYLAMVEVALCLLLFVACALHVRWRQKAAKAAIAAAQASSQSCTMPGCCASCSTCWRKALHSNCAAGESARRGR